MVQGLSPLDGYTDYFVNYKRHELYRLWNTFCLLEIQLALIDVRTTPRVYLLRENVTACRSWKWKELEGTNPDMINMGTIVSRWGTKAGDDDSDEIFSHSRFVAMRRFVRDRNNPSMKDDVFSITLHLSTRSLKKTALKNNVQSASAPRHRSNFHLPESWKRAWDMSRILARYTAARGFSECKNRFSLDAESKQRQILESRENNATRISFPSLIYFTSNLSYFQFLARVEYKYVS